MLGLEKNTVGNQIWTLPFKALQTVIEITYKVQCKVDMMSMIRKIKIIDQDLRR